MLPESIKKHYDLEVATRSGGNYEQLRWHSSPIQAAAWKMTAAAVQHLAGDWPLKPGERILEVGPGPGTWTRLLAGLFPAANFILVDISSAMLAEARERLADQAAELVEADFSHYRGSPADYFFSARALEYFADKPAFFTSLQANLAAGGQGIIITKLPHYWRDRWRGRPAPERHQYQLRPRILKRHLRAAGCRVLKIIPVTISVPFFRSPRLNGLVGAILHRLPFGFWAVPWTESYAVHFVKL